MSSKLRRLQDNFTKIFYLTERLAFFRRCGDCFFIIVLLFVIVLHGCVFYTDFLLHVKPEDSAAPATLPTVTLSFLRSRSAGTGEAFF